VALLLKHINEPMPSVKQFRPGIPTAVEQVIYRATAKTPDNRYPSAGDLGAAFVEAAYQPASRPEVLSQHDDQPTLVPEPGSPIRLTPLRMTPPNYPTPGQAAYPGTGQQAGMQQVPPRSRTPRLLIGLIVVGALFVVGTLLVIINRPAEPLPPTPAVALMPTPFTNARIARHDRYTISVPDSWQFVDLSDNDRLIHVWQRNLEAYIGLTLIPSDESDFQAQSDAFLVSHYPEDAYSFIDEATAPDGSVRSSHRLFGQANPPFEPGQTDTFFLNRPPYVVVLELFASDTLGNGIVPEFQQVLDSLRINAVPEGA
jgi:hypothetical protein